MAEAQATINVALNTSQVASQLRALQTQINAFSNSLNKGNVLQANEAKRFQQQLLDTVNTSRFFTAEIVKMRSAASALDVTLSKGQATMGQYFSARFIKNSTAAAQVMSLANARARALETQFIATSGAAGGFREAIAVRPIAAFSDATTVSAQKLAIHRAMLRQATTSMINFGKNTQWAGRQLMVGFTVPLTIFGAAAGKTFRDIERQAVQFKKVYGDIFTPPEEMEQNLNAVMDLAKEYTKYGIALKDTLGLAAEAAAAGSRNAALTDAVTAATRLSTLGQMEQAQALETTIALQNAFQLQSTELADAINFLNMVENQTVVTLQDLAAAIPRVAPVIKGLGGDVRDLAAFMAAMQEGGVSAEQGANALKSGLASLINPTDKASEKLKEMGININAIIQTNRGDLMATVQAFSTALKTLDEFERQQALEQVFGKFQYARLGALFANITKEGSQAAQALDIARQSSEQLAASADKELSIIEESFGVKFTAAVERFKIAIMPIGEMFTKLAIPLINFAAKIAEAFNNLPDFAKNFIGLASVIGGVVIPVGTMFLGLIFNLIGTLIKFGHIVSVSFKGFMTGGISGAIAAVSQSLKYMSLQEIDAAVASQQLGRSADYVNNALLRQVGAAESARTAITELSAMYKILSASMRESAAVMPATMFVPGAAAAAARGPVRRNKGGTIPGFGQNKDTVPAMLTPGEFVVKREATADNLDLLHAINSGTIKQFAIGGPVIGGASLVARRAQEMAGGASSFARQIMATTLPKAVQTRFPTKQQQLRDLVFAKTAKGQLSARAKTIQFAEKVLGLNVGLKAKGNYGFFLSKNLNQVMARQGLTGSLKSQLLNELNSDIPYASIQNQYRTALGKELNISAFRKILQSELSSVRSPLTNARFEKASRNALRKYMDSDNINRVARKGFLKNLLSDSEIVSTGLSSSDVINALQKNKVPFERDGSRNIYVLDSQGRRTGINLRNVVYSDIAKVKQSDGFLGRKTIATRINASALGLQFAHANKGGLIPEMATGGIAGAFKFGPAMARALKGKYSPIFTPAIPGTRMYGFGEGARQPAIGGAPGKPTTILNLIKEASTDPKLAGRKQFRLMVNGKEIVVNRLGQRQLDRLGTGSFMRMPFETRPISQAKEKQFYDQWVAAKRPGRGSEYEAFGNWMLGKGYQRNRTTGEFFKPFRADVNEPILGEVLMPRSAMGRQQQEFPSWMQNFMAGGQVLKMQQVQKIISKLGPDQARRYFAGMQTNAADQKVINSALSRTARRMSPAFRSRQAMSVSDMDKNFDSFKWSRLSGKYVLSENAVNHMLRSGQRVVYYPDLRSGELQNALNSNRFVVTKKNGRLVFNNQFGLETTLPKSADGKYNVFSPDEIFFANQGGMAFDSSRRNIVPGMGDKDTVPAVLTPGEFVINKDATKRNLDLLHAINSGKIANMNAGGQVIPIQGFNDGMQVKEVYDKKTGRPSGYVAYGEDGQRLGFFRSKSQAKAALRTTSGMGGMGAKFGISMGIGAAGGALMMGAGSVSNQAVAGAMSTGGTALSMLSILPFLGKAAGPVAGIVAAGAAIVSVVSGMKSLANSVKDLNNAMLGSTEKADAMAKAFGRTTNVQQVAVQRAQAAGAPIGEQAIQAGGQFLQTAAGAGLLKDLETVRRAGEDQTQALINQLQRNILAGAITPEEAKGIAVQIGQALGSQRVGVQAAVRIEQIFGPNGEKLKENRLLLTSQIIPSIDLEELERTTPELVKRMGEIDFSRGFDVSAFGASLITLGGKVGNTFLEQEAKLRQIQNVVKESAQIEQEAIAAIIIERQQGVITLEEYRDKLQEILNLNIAERGFTSAVKATAQVQGLTESQLASAGQRRISGGALAGLQTAALAAGPLGPVGIAALEAVYEKTDKAAVAANRFYTNTRKSYEEAAKAQGLTEDQIKLSVDLVNQISKTPVERANILQSLSAGGVNPVVLDKLQAMSNDKTLEKIFPADLKDRAKYLKDISLQMQTFSAIPGLEQKIIDIAVQEKTDSGKPVKETIREYEDAYMAVEQIPDEVKKFLEIDLADPQALLRFEESAPKIKKSYDDVAKYIQQTSDDISKKEIQQKVVSYYAGENADTAQKLIDMVGKKFDPVTLPLVIALSGTEKIAAYLDILQKGISAGARGADPGQARMVLDQAVQDLKILEKAADPKNFEDKKDSGPGGAKSALQQLIENYKNQIEFARIRDKMMALPLPEELIAQLEGMGTEGLKIANSLLEGKNQELKKLAERANTLATTKMIADQINELSQSIKNIKLQKTTFNDLLGMGVSREDARELINNSSFMLAIEKAKGKEKTNLINKAREELAVQKSLTEELKSQSEKQLEAIDKQIQIKDERLNLLQLQEQQLRIINIQPIQDQIDAIERINQGIARSIELEQRKIEPIQKAIEGLEEQKTKVDERYDTEIEAVNEAYDTRIQALERAEQINERIVQQQQNQIGLASALSRGDIAAAAQAMLQMRRDDAAARAEDTRKALEAQKEATIKELEVAREREIDAIQAQINVKKSEQEAIEAVIESLQFQQLQNSDRIYELNQLIEAQEFSLIGILQQQRDLEREILALKIAQAQVTIGAQAVENVVPSVPLTAVASATAPTRTTYSATRVVGNKLLINKGGKVPGFAYGGMMSYKGSREPAPGMAFGGMMKKYANGSFVSGMGNTDRVPALLTPGEYVINKASTKAFLPLLQMINGSKFPSMLGKGPLGAGQDIKFNMPTSTDIKFNMPQDFNTDVELTTKTNSFINAPQRYNNYVVNVGVEGTNASPDLIASAVIGKIRSMEDRSIRGVRY